MLIYIINKLHMNRELLLLFNNGRNNGIIKFITADNTSVNCHDFVYSRQCDYGKFSLEYQPITTNDERKVLLTDYSENIICMVISRMYSDEYVFKDLDPWEIIEIIALADFLMVKYLSDIIADLAEMFYSGLNENNWLKLLEKIHGHYAFEKLEEKILYYYELEIINRDHIIAPISDTNIISVIEKINNDNAKINSVLDIKFRISKLRYRKQSNISDDYIDNQIDALVNELHQIENDP